MNFGYFANSCMASKTADYASTIIRQALTELCKYSLSVHAHKIHGGENRVENDRWNEYIWRCPIRQGPISSLDSTICFHFAVRKIISCFSFYSREKLERKQKAIICPFAQLASIWIRWCRTSAHLQWWENDLCAWDEHVRRDEFSADFEVRMRKKIDELVNRVENRDEENAKSKTQISQ